MRVGFREWFREGEVKLGLRLGFTEGKLELGFREEFKVGKGLGFRESEIGLSLHLRFREGELQLGLREWLRLGFRECEVGLSFLWILKLKLKFICITNNNNAGTSLCINSLPSKCKNVFSKSFLK